MALGEHEHEDNNPIVITILVLFHGLMGILWIVVGITLLFVPTASARFHDTIENLSYVFSSLTNELMGLLFLFSAVVALSVAWAFWALKPWARIIALLMVIMNITIEAATQNWLDLIFNLFILVCLFHPTVRAMFSLDFFRAQEG